MTDDGYIVQSKWNANDEYCKQVTEMMFHAAKLSATQDFWGWFRVLEAVKRNSIRFFMEYETNIDNKEENKNNKTYNGLREAVLKEMSLNTKMKGENSRLLEEALQELHEFIVMVMSFYGVFGGIKKSEKEEPMDSLL